MKKIILIDGNSLMYRAYHATAAMGNLMKNSKGLYTNAVYSFANMITGITKNKFDNILVAFDAGKMTFRHELVADYKGGRSPMPEEMKVQIPYVKSFLDNYGIKRYEMPLYEADDIIGTMAKKAKENGFIVTIYSSDKDLLQLVDDNVYVNLLRKGISDIEVFDKEHIIQRYELTNKQMIDLKALMGDPSDNLKGIPGVGEKTAIKLLKDYNSLEELIEKRSELKGKLKEKVDEFYNEALICKKMVTIDQNSPIEIELDDTIYEGFDQNKLIDFYKELEFHSLLKRIDSEKKKETNIDIDSSDILYLNEKNMNEALKNNSSIYLELDNPNYHNASFIGFALANGEKTYFVEEKMFSNDRFISFLENNDMKKMTFDNKKIRVFLKKKGIDLKGVDFDLLLAGYVNNPLIGKEELRIITQEFGYDDVSYDEVVYGKGAKFSVDLATAIPHIMRKAEAILKLKDQAIEQLKAKNQINLLDNIELPLSNVLADMEFFGMKVDREELKRQKDALKISISSLEEDIFALAGIEFNISSPKQLGEILFERLNLPTNKKNKTGYSTDQDTLEKLTKLHPIASKLLEYRQLTKLYSTYIEGINNVLFDDDCVHTIFKQALTQTGRLSSIEPNLQNIPIRKKEGKLIRKMFIPKYDYLLSADYSQIELRIVASMADCKELVRAFNEGRDIHEETAKLVFEKDNVDKEERQRAKAVNFGIIYGISAFGLSNDIKIPIYEAQRFIDKYLATFSEVKKFMADTVEFATKNGYVLTLLNRRRYIDELKNPQYMIREFGKRTAMNAPIQGTAADIIKIAMINISEKIKERNLESKLISQVHDELIFDCKKEEIDELMSITKTVMENAFKLSVPLIVEMGYGTNWLEVK